MHEEGKKIKKKNQNIQGVFVRGLGKLETHPISPGRKVLHCKAATQDTKEYVDAG